MGESFVSVVNVMFVGREIVLLTVQGKLQGKYVFEVVKQFSGSGYNKI